jgi:hypothetical protein
MDDPEEALSFSRGQHAGSRGPAVMLARTVDLKGARRLLDVGGGSGAFSITLCQRFPGLTATILDFPGVQTPAAAFVRDAGMSDRITFTPGRRADHGVARGSGRRVALVSPQRGLRARRRPAPRAGVRGAGSRRTDRHGRRRESSL